MSDILTTRTLGFDRGNVAGFLPTQILLDMFCGCPRGYLLCWVIGMLVLLSLLAGRFADS